MTVIVFSFSFSLKLFWFRIAKNAVNIHVFQSRTDANGKPIGEHGSYHLRDGSIHIDLNAGNLGQGVMAYTIAHEFTHFMEQQSPAKFQAFTDAIFTELDLDVEADIEDKAEKLKRQHPEQYRNASRETLLQDARSEVVAEACETMLTDTDAAQRIGQSLKAKDATLFEKVKQWFRDLADKIRKAYKGLHPDSEIAQYAKKTIQQVDGLVQMWADMAVDAAENYRKSVVTENNGRNGMKLSPRVGTSEDGLSMYEGSFPKGTPKSAKSKVILDYIQNVWAKKPIPLNITEADGSQRTILAQFDPTYDPEIKGDASKIAGGNRHGNAVEQRVTLDLGPDYHQILSESSFNYSKQETGKDSEAHKGVKTWHYFVDNIYFAEKGSKDFLPFTVSINVKEKETGNFVYSFSAEKRESSTPGTLHAQVSSPISEVTDAEFSRPRVPQQDEKVNPKNSDRDDVESEFYNAGVKYSSRVTDKDTLSFLDNQETITTYKTMQIVDGRLYPPMAARIDGKHEDYSVLGVWEQATEHPELIKGNGKFKLDKGKGQGSIDAAYNPYMHSSNLVINDQFTGAYTRDNLVTVECEVPASELTSGYHAQYAKDSVGWHAWHTGTVAGAIRKAKGIERQVFLSRWIKPVRIVTDAEVASMYRDLLDGTDIAVPDNVVTPSLLSELKKTGVTISESGRVMNSGDPGKKISNTGLVEPTSTADAADRGNTSANSIRNPEQVVNKKFSMRDNVEKTKDLIAVHNLSEEKLLKSLNLGGLPMPSIAILRAKDGHNKFGDISLVFSKDTIDPELSRVNKVYSADAWTPTYPKIDYKANDRVEDRISSKYNELVKRFGYDAAKPLYRYAFHVCNIGCWVWA